MDEQEPKIKKTVTLTHRQLGLGGGVLAAIMTLSPMKEWFFTRDEGKAQIERLDKTEVAIKELKADLNAKIDKSTEMIIDSVKEARDQSYKDADRLERRVDSIEVALRMPKFKKESN